MNAEVKVLSAGHGPILCYRRVTNKLENFEAQGIPLGMIAGMSYEDSSVKRLNAGDMIVLVTDGFYEWQNRSRKSLASKDWRTRFARRVTVRRKK